MRSTYLWIVSYFFFSSIWYRQMQCIRALNMDQVLVRMIQVRWPNGHWSIWLTNDKMALAQWMVHLQIHNVVKSTIITCQITGRIYFRWKRKYFAEHFHVMETVLWPPVKVIFETNYYNVIVFIWHVCLVTLQQFVLFFFCSLFIFVLPPPPPPSTMNTMTDSVIRVHDSSTSQYKRVNEITAKNINWCILDVGFSPNGQHFAYSTWSSSSK